MYNTQPLIMDLTITDCNSNLVYNTHLCLSHKCLGKKKCTQLIMILSKNWGCVTFFVQSDKCISISYFKHTVDFQRQFNILMYKKVCVKCRTKNKTKKALFLYFNFHVSVMLDSLSCSFTSIFFLTTRCINCSNLLAKFVYMFTCVSSA